jgi:hypothetical protein
MKNLSPKQLRIERFLLVLQAIHSIFYPSTSNDPVTSGCSLKLLQWTFVTMDKDTTMDKVMVYRI